MEAPDEPSTKLAGKTDFQNDRVSHIMNERGGVPWWQDKEKVELLNAFFVSVYNARSSPEEPHTPEITDDVGIKEEFAFVDEGWVKDRLRKLDIHKFIGPDGMHSQVLREPVEAIARPLSIIFGKSRASGEVPDDWRKANVTPVF